MEYILKEHQRHFSRLLLSVLVFICTFAIYTSPILGNPVDGQVTAGNASISSPAINTVQINQNSDKAIIDWQSFNIAAQEKTQFIQPSTSSVALNRINPAQGMSQIFGSLISNGEIILINQAGLFFASGAQVNVGSIIASSIDITNQNFFLGKYIFDQPSLYAGTITNQGSIIAAEHGLVALLGQGVSNTGLIQANLGTVLLGSGKQFTITFSDNKLLSFSVDGDTVNNGVNNTGKIIANGGTVLISANTASSILDNAINTTGIIEAHSITEHNGVIILSANGAVSVSGTLNVSGKKGGTIKVLGKRVHLSPTAILNANGIYGGGEILIGGNLHGAGAEANSLKTSIDAGALIEANALQNGNGGKIVIWSNDVTNYAGHLSAMGGAFGGNGGFAEVSGQKLLNFHGTVDLSAAQGSTGTLLLDPENLTIQSAGSSTVTTSGSTYTSNADNSILTVEDLQNALANANILVQTGAGGLQVGDITVANNITWSNLNTLTLSAFRNININATISNTSSGSLTLKADNTGTGVGTIIFSGITPQITMSGGGAVNAYYNPATFPTPTDFSSNVTVSGGSSFTPYMLVNTFINLQNMNNNLSGNYALGKNIDASVGLFVPVGTSAANFTGQFDGQNHTIDSLSVLFPLASNIGLFGYVNSSGSIQNVGLTNATITGLNNVGSLIGYLEAGTINNVYSTGSVTANAISNNIGGLIGFSGGNISNSYSTTTILTGATTNYVGGLVGQSIGNISNSYHATGSITVGATSTYVGGLAGYTFGTVSNSYNTGHVTIGATGSLYEGGLIGYSVGTVSGSYNSGAVTAGAAVTNVGGLVGYGFGSINTSYSTGAIDTGATGSANIGGLVGFANGDVSNSYSNSSILGGAANVNLGGLVGQNNAIISNSYSTGNVASGAGSTILGGLVGLNTGTVINSFWDTQTSGQLASDGGAGKTTAQMMQQTTFCPSGSCNGDSTHFDFANTWSIIEGITYPQLQALTLNVSGKVFSNINGLTPVANNVISLVSEGTILNGSVISQSQAISDSSGYYYFLLNKSYFSQTSPLMAFVSAGITVGNTLFIPTGTTVTANIYGNTVYTQGSGSLSNSLLASTKGSLSDTGILYSASGNNLSLGNAVHTTANFVSALNTPYTINGNMTPFAGASNSFTFNGDVTVTGNSIVLAGNTFTNNSATFTLNPGGGTFLVWSDNPANDTRGGIIYDFKQYNALFGTTVVQGTGTGFLYTLAPVISPALIDSLTKIYDTNTTATLVNSNYSNTGAVDGDTVTLNNPSSGLYGTANVGTNLNVSVSAISIASASNGSATVYGYQLTSTTANANIGNITPATLTYNANIETIDYGSTLPAFSGTVNGFLGGETQATATTGNLAFTSLATSSSNIGNYAINGSGLTANNGNYVFVQAAGNATALDITPATLIYNANTVTMTYGDPAPAFSGTVTGFVNNQTQATATTGSLAFTSLATSGSNIGNYAINGSGLTANNGNYVFVQAAGNATALDITQTDTTPITVTQTDILQTDTTPISVTPTELVQSDITPISTTTMTPDSNSDLIARILNPTTNNNFIEKNNTEISDILFIKHTNSATRVNVSNVINNKTDTLANPGLNNAATDSTSVSSAGKVINQHTGSETTASANKLITSDVSLSKNYQSSQERMMSTPLQIGSAMLISSLLAILLWLLLIFWNRKPRGQEITLDTQWVSGISTVKTEEGLLYVAVIIDLYSRGIVGWSMQDTTVDSIQSALTMASWRKHITPETISQSGALKTNYRHVWDNTVAEKFFHRLNADLLYHQHYFTREQAKQSIFEYIELIYNRLHSHSHLGYQASNFEKYALAA